MKKYNVAKNTMFLQLREREKSHKNALLNKSADLA
jgi:hypothetical protein